MFICHLVTDHQLEEVRTVFREYYEELLKVDTCFREFEKELEELPGEYSGPGGALLLVMDKKTVTGCVALRKIDNEICEMKRLYVRRDVRGLGLGRQLVERIIEEAISRGYEKIRLDTLAALDAANTLYQSLGFRKIDAYLEEGPEELLYWGLNLK